LLPAQTKLRNKEKKSFCGCHSTQHDNIDCNDNQNDNRECYAECRNLAVMSSVVRLNVFLFCVVATFSEYPAEYLLSSHKKYQLIRNLGLTSKEFDMKLKPMFTVIKNCHDLKILIDNKVFLAVEFLFKVG
jgi:hypothetical protein